MRQFFVFTNELYDPNIIYHVFQRQLSGKITVLYADNNQAPFQIDIDSGAGNVKKFGIKILPSLYDSIDEAQEAVKKFNDNISFLENRQSLISSAYILEIELNQPIKKIDPQFFDHLSDKTMLSLYACKISPFKLNQIDITLPNNIVENKKSKKHKRSGGCSIS